MLDSLQNNKCQEIFPTIMLETLEINSSFPLICMYDISDTICQIHRLHLDQFFIQQKHDLNFRNLCYHYCVSTSVCIYLVGGVVYYVGNLSCLVL